MPYCCMGNVESRTRAYSRIRAPSLDEMGIADPGPLPLTFHDKQTQVTERLISREYFKREVHEASKKQIQNPTEFLDFHVDFFKARNLKGVEKRDYLHEVIGNIKLISDVIIKNELIKDLSEKLGTKELELVQILNTKRIYNNSEITQIKPSSFEFKTKLQRAELELVKIFINSTLEERIELKKSISLELFSHQLLKKIISKILIEKSTENSKFIEQFSEKNERDFISELLIDENMAQDSMQIVKDCVKTIKSIPIKNRIDDLRFIIQNKEKSGDDTSKELTEVMKLQKNLIHYRS